MYVFHEKIKKAKRNKTVKEDALKASKMNPGAWVACVVLMFYALCLLSPYVLGLLSSFKTLSNYTEHMFSFTELTFDNYKDVITGFVYPIILKDGSAGY